MSEESQVINSFALKMQEKLFLRHDRYLPMAWKDLDLKRLIWLLEGELMELKSINEHKETGNALQHQLERTTREMAMQDNAVDIANYAMFIWKMYSN